MHWASTGLEQLIRLPNIIAEMGGRTGLLGKVAGLTSEAPGSLVVSCSGEGDSKVGACVESFEGTTEEGQIGIGLQSMEEQLALGNVRVDTPFFRPQSSMATSLAWSSFFRPEAARLLSVKQQSSMKSKSW